MRESRDLIKATNCGSKVKERKKEKRKSSLKKADPDLKCVS